MEEASNFTISFRVCQSFVKAEMRRIGCRRNRRATRTRCNLRAYSFRRMIYVISFYRRMWPRNTSETCSDFINRRFDTISSNKNFYCAPGINSPTFVYTAFSTYSPLPSRTRIYIRTSYISKVSQDSFIFYSILLHTKISIEKTNDNFTFFFFLLYKTYHKFFSSAFITR